MSSKIGVHWQALPAVAVATAFLFAVSDKGYSAETDSNAMVVAAAPVTLPTGNEAPMASTIAPDAVETVPARGDDTPIAPGGVVFEETLAEAPAANRLSLSDEDMTCLAKIIHHESANQPEAGQLAVAHVVLNRLASPRFPKTVCAIALQPRQFFNVHAYDPSGDRRWTNSQRIARMAVEGHGDDHAPGALFFHTAGHNSAFFRSRPRVVQIAGHVFYR
ncbi:cell wall hydrolase [Sphingomonas lacunae]|uniref:Cell wall hydrolase n=1 Tax=Sphingomonas lacunae TaxID=2698828 RepID=A0A6M4AW54_9SPHN|nr:cell wall hydrolase [Sphingomonas lacunae]QJQ31211.1 cell wall hydrolase [Sphingomonas lacunae]